MEVTKPPTWSLPVDQFVAGMGAGAVTTTLLHPLDLIKVNLQGEPSTLGSETPPPAPLPPSIPQWRLTRMLFLLVG